jgi:hypothetical protein
MHGDVKRHERKEAMKFSNFIEGLQILQPYYNEDGYNIAAEHDQFYAYPTDRPLPTEAVAKLVELGWFQPECGFKKPEDYQPKEGWSAFT